jgi:dihydrofolate reductase
VLRSYVVTLLKSRSPRFARRAVQAFLAGLAIHGSTENELLRLYSHDEILKLKQEQGKNILVGRVDIPSQLIELRLVDEYRFVVGPIVVGEGRRLLEGVSL